MTAPDLMHPSGSELPSPGSAQRLPVLDGIRGLAVVLVMLMHFSRDLTLLRTGFFSLHTDWLRTGLQGLDTYSYGQMLFLMLCKSCWIGVDLFFVLSGFLITRILVDLLDHAVSPRRYFTLFYARRALRIWPLYLAFLLVMFLLLPSAGIDMISPETHARQGWFWAHLMNVYVLLHGWPERSLDHLWSLAVEEQFYLVWPLLIFFTPRRWRFGLMAGVVAGAILCRISGNQWPQYSTVNYVLPMMRMDAFAIGGALGLLYDRSRMKNETLRAWRPAFYAAVGTGLLMIGVLFVMRGVNYFLIWGRSVQIAGYTVLALMFAGLVGLALESPERGWLQRIFITRGMRALGKYSYAMYLFQLPLDELARRWGVNPLEWEASPDVRFGWLLVYMPAMALMTFGLAWLSWHGYEKHWLRLKTRFDWRPAPLPVP